MDTLHRRWLNALCDHLRARRAAILRAWREASDADRTQSTARSLTRSQFNDHIPGVLDAFELKLKATPGGTTAASADRDQEDEQVKHGLHRWQQGYPMEELMNEWGLLQLCLIQELDNFVVLHPNFPPAVLGAVNRRMMNLVNEALRESAAQYARLQQAEAASRVGGLQLALQRVHSMEHGRSMLIHQAVHDINNSAYGVQVAAQLLDKSRDDDAARAQCTTLLQDGVQGVTSMLAELLELARLEAGQETRNLASFDASALVRSVVSLSQPVASARGLRLSQRGPRLLRVKGDESKVRRLLQNLVWNALKYTEEGSVKVSWGAATKSWWLKVSDTGPGLPAGLGAPLAASLIEATASARESDVEGAATPGKGSKVLKPAAGGPAAGNTAAAQPGEGIGLSIVKRLCELLDASLETASSADSGTTFRIVLPRRYAVPRKRSKKQKKRS